MKAAEPGDGYDPLTTVEGELHVVEREVLVEAFAAWDRDWREHPEEFASIVGHLLRETPETYGDGATACLLAYVEKIEQART